MVLSSSDAGLEHGLKYKLVVLQDRLMTTFTLLPGDCNLYC